MDSLKGKAIKGVGWSAAETGLRYGISFVVSIVLARILGPDDYGLIGILTVFIAVFNSIVDSGFTNALIRKKEIGDIDYSTMFITNFVLSLFLTTVLFLSAKPISIFFNRPELIDLTKVMSSIIIINSFSLVQRARLTRAIDFKTQTKITVIASCFSGVIGISMAFCGFGVWALVGQQISNQLLTSILLWSFNKWIPKFEFSKNSFIEMWGFGWKLLASGLINTTWNEIYQVVIGKCYSPATLGQYTRAKQFRDLFSTNLYNVIQKVTYPVLSTLQEENVRLKSAYRRVIKTTMLPTFIIMLSFAACSKSVVFVLVGEQWLPCVPMLQIICFNGMLIPLHSLNLNMLQVQGRSDLFLKLEIYKKIIAIIPILIGIFINIYWMLITGFITGGCIDYLLNSYYSGKLIGYSSKDQLRDIFPSLGIALAIALPVFALSFLPVNPFVLLPIQLLVGVGIAFVLLEKSHLEEYKELKQIAIPIIKKIPVVNKVIK